MAITFTKERKIQRSLIFALGGIVAVMLLILWLGFFKTQAPSRSTAPTKPSSSAKNIELDWSVLDGPQFARLGNPQALAPLPQTVGRANPFLPFKSR